MADEENKPSEGNTEPTATESAAPVAESPAPEASPKPESPTSENTTAENTKPAAKNENLEKAQEVATKVIKEGGFIFGKLIKDISKSVKEIADDYKNRKQDDSANQSESEKKDKE